MSIRSFEIHQPSMPNFCVDVITPHQNHLSFLICGFAYDEPEITLEILEDADLMAAWFVEEYRDAPCSVTVRLFTPEGEERVLMKKDGYHVARIKKTSMMTWERFEGRVLKYTVVMQPYVAGEVLFPDDDPYAEIPDAPDEIAPFVDFPLAPRAFVSESESHPPALEPVSCGQFTQTVDTTKGVYSGALFGPAGLCGPAIHDPVVGPVTHYDDGGAPRVIDDGLDPRETLEMREQRWREEARRRDLPWSRGTED